MLADLLMFTRFAAKRGFVQLVSLLALTLGLVAACASSKEAAPVVEGSAVGLGTPGAGAPMAGVLVVSHTS